MVSPKFPNSYLLIVHFLSELTRAVTQPGRAFDPEDTPTFSMFTLLVLVFAVTAAGEILIIWHTRSPVMREIALVESRHIAEQGAIFAGDDEIQEQQAKIYRRLIWPSTPAAKTFFVMLSSGALLASIGMTWVVLIVLMQFFGGEEPVAPGRPRTSIQMVGTAFVPLGIRRLLSGALTLATDPESAANATTVEEYRELTIARFDLSSIASWTPPVFFDRAAALLSDPFSLWALSVLAVGSTTLMRLPLRRAIAQTACLAVVWVVIETVFGGRLAILI